MAQYQRPLSIILFALLTSGWASAQSADLNSMHESARTAENRWVDLAESLDLRLARMLPCDRRVTEAIQEVRQASVDRMTSLERYLSAAITATQAEGDAAADLHSMIQARVAGTATEANDTQRERAAFAQLIEALNASIARLPNLEPALTQLLALQTSVQRRAEFDQVHQEAENQTLTALASLVAALDERQAALEQERLAHEVERARWNSYYTTRLGRAQLECSITGQ